MSKQIKPQSLETSPGHKSQDIGDYPAPREIFTDDEYEKLNTNVLLHNF